MKEAQSKPTSELPREQPEMTVKQSTLEAAGDAKPREVDGWHFKAHTMPPGLRMELVAAELPEVPETELYRSREATESGNPESPPEPSAHRKRRRTLLLLFATLGSVALAFVVGLALSDPGLRNVPTSLGTERQPTPPRKTAAPATMPARPQDHPRGLASASRSLDDVAAPRAERGPNKEGLAPPQPPEATPRSASPSQAVRPAPARVPRSVEPTLRHDIASPEPVAPATTESPKDPGKSWIQVRD